MSMAAQWANINQIPASNLLHTQTLTNVCASTGNLEFDTFCLPDIDCRIIGGLIYHNCETGAIASWTDEPICHVYQDGTGTCVKPDCWTLTPKSHSDAYEICWTADPCTRLHELRCCLMQWIKEGRKTSWSFRDSSGSTAFATEKCLKELIATADDECDAQCGVNTRCVSYKWDSSICG